MRNFKFSMPIRLVSLVVALLLLISIFPMSIFATDKDVAAVNGDIDAVPVGEVADVTDDGTITIYFQNNWMWPDANIHYWGSKTATNPSWTGIALTEAVATTEEGYTIYKFELPADVEGFLFNGTGEYGFEQSDDIKDGWYDGICYYMTYDADTNTKPCGSYEYVVVEPTPPSIFESITYTDSKGGTLTPDNNVLPWVNDEVMISIKVKENSGISKVTVDGEEATKNGDLYTYIAKNSNSAKIFAIVATDADGNVISQETTDRIQIDKTDPSIEEIKYYKGGKELDQNDLNNGYFHWTNADITVKFKVTDLAINQQEVKVNGKIATSSEDGVYSYTFSEDCNSTFKISATDEAGNNTEVDTIGISIDKTAPEIYDVKYYAGKEELTPEKGVLPWTNKEVTVKFKIFEAPAENCGSGIDFVTVDNKTITETDGVYSYTEIVKDEMSFDENISIVVKDCAGNQGTVDTSEIRIDKIKPVISDVKYYTVEEENGATKETELVPVDGSLPWTNKKVVAKFNVTDEDSGVKSVKIGDTSLTPESEKNGVYSYSHEFKIDENSESVLELDELTITAKDAAGNSADEKKTAKVRIEDIAPVAEAYIFPISAKDVLKFLSFGIYGNADEVQVTVRAYDKHSDIKEVYLYYKDGTQVDSSVVNEQLDKMAKSGRSYATFTLSSVYVGLRAVAVDNAGNISDGLKFSDGLKYFATLDEASFDEESFDEASFDQASFDECTPDEIVISDAQPGIDFVPSADVIDVDGKDWFNCGVIVKAQVHSDSKLKTVNYNRITPDEDYNSDISYSFSDKPIAEYSETFSEVGEGNYKITVTAQSYNTQSITASYEYNVDYTAPVISNITYKDIDGNILEDTEELAWVNKDVIVEFTVKEKGSGIKAVKIGDAELTPVSENNGIYRYSYTVKVADSGSLVHDFDIYAEDNVGFTDEETTSNIRIDKIKPVVETFTFEKTAETVISFLTFGIYSCDDIKVTVKASDETDSSGIKSIALYDGETLLGEKEYGGASSEIKEVFTLTEGEYTNIKAVAIDTVNNSSGITVMDNNNAYASQDEVYQISSPDEIVVSGEQAEITFAPDSDVIDIDGEDWYNCPVSVKTDIDALKTKIKEAHITRETPSDDYDYDEKFDFTKLEKATVKYSDTFTEVGDGNYKITVTAQSNNNTAKVTASYEYNIDMTAPVISNVTYADSEGNELGESEELSWVDKDVTVSFTVKEQGSGIKVVKIGNKVLTPVSVEDGVYSYNHTIKVADADTFTDGFEIYAEDKVGFTASDDTSTIRIDKVKPEISEVTYTDSDGNVLDDADDLAWINKDVTVSFNVTEKNSGINVVKIGSKKLDPTTVVDGVYSYTYTIEVADADSFIGDYEIYAEDNVGLNERKTTSNIRIDKIKPVVETFTFKKTVDTVISFLTFGIYSCEDIEVIVKATDQVDSSGIRFIALYDGETQLDSKTYDGTSSDISEVFTLVEGRYTNINAVAIDIADNNSGITVMDKVINAEDNSTHSFASPDEIVVSGEQPDVTLTHSENEVVTVINDMPWYKADVKFGIEIKAPETKLQNVAITLNNADIADTVIGAQNYANTPITDVAGDYTVSEDGKYTIDVVANSNNNTPAVTKSYTFSRDTKAPEISNVTYYTLNTVVNETTKEETVTETQVDPESSWFSEDIRIKFNVTEQGSGIKVVKIGDTELTPVSVANGVYSYSYDINVADNDSFNKIFTIYAEDMVNWSAEINTAAVRVDKKDPVISNIEYWISGDNELIPVDGSLPWTNEDVTVSFQVTEEHSGIKAVTIGGEAPTFREEVEGVYYYSYTKSVATGGSFDLALEIYAQDNVANDSKLNTAVINIDKIAPAIEVQYDNPDHKVYQGNEYYKANRTATITVVERNFDPNKFVLDITNTDGSISALSGWNTVEAGDQSKHTATVTFANDGDYTMTMDCTDAVGNKADVKPEMQKFTIDKTLPTVDVTFDNNSALNNAYYSSDRTATITINEHNFAVDAEHLTVNVTATAGDNTTSVTPPAVVDWSHSGDVHTARIHFTEDGSYEITVDFKDFAYNEAEQFVVDKFYIDETKPEIQFNQVENNVAYGGVIAPQVIMTDNNYDTYTTFTLQRIDIDSKAMDVELYRSSASNGDSGETITYSNFPEVELNDGIYKLTVRIVDKAGNEDSKEIVFSVNRFGSTYMAGDENTSSLIADGYTNAEQDIVIKEINVNKVSAQKMSLALNNANISELVANKDYSVRTIGGENSWYEYSYIILKENFKEEGFYTLTLSSTDRVKHTVSNRTALTDERKYPVSFTVDKTLPGIRITGVESNEPYKDAQRDVRVVYEDANIDPEKMTIKLNGEILKAGEDYELNTDNAGEAVASFKVKAVGKNTKQNIEVVVIDKADNENTLSVSDFILSASWFRRFLANTPLAITVFSILGVGIILLIVLLAKKRKQEE